MKPKYTKKEQQVFADKPYLIILTLPFRFSDKKYDRKFSSFLKKFSEINISIVFSKKATNNTFYHLFGYYKKITDVISPEKTVELFYELNSITKFYNDSIPQR